MKRTQKSEYDPSKDPIGFLLHPDDETVKKDHSTTIPTLGKAFLDATVAEANPATVTEVVEKPVRETPPITGEMRRYLDEVEWALHRLEEDIYKPKSKHDVQNFRFAISIGGISLQQYVEHIAKNMVNQVEYDYVVSTIYKMVDRVLKIGYAVETGQGLDDIPEPPYVPDLAKYTRRKRK